MKFFYLILIASSLSYCQSEFINGNDFGIGTGYTYSANDLSKSSSFEGVFTFIGAIDLGLQFSNGTVDINRKINSSSSTFYLAYNFKRQNTALNLKIILGYQVGSVERHYYTSKMKSSGLLVGVGFYPSFIKTKPFFWMGVIELLYGFNSVAPASVPQNSELIDTRSISAGFNLGFTLFPKFNLVLSPFISKDLINDDISAFYGISGRIIFSFGLIDQ